jgi:replication factor C subunit 2/4
MCLISEFTYDGEIKKQNCVYSDKPWIERYRPVEIEEVVGNFEIVSKLQYFSENGNFPNLILSGPPGIGKTTSVLCVARRLLGFRFRDAVLELNASDERGVDVVNNKINIFASKMISLEPEQHKIIILDEADSMTVSAQQNLRRLIEHNETTTRFILVCNQSNKVLEAIQSRCAIIRCSKLSDREVMTRLLKICEAENVDYSDDGLESIIFTADGDLRKAINNLQTTYKGHSLVNQENVFRICDQPHPLIVIRIVEECILGNIEEAFNKIENLNNLGYSKIDIIGTIYKVSENSYKLLINFPSNLEQNLSRKLLELLTRVDLYRQNESLGCT